MKKINITPLYILIVLLLLIVFAACDTAEQNNADTSADTTATTAAGTEANTVSDTQAETQVDTQAPPSADTVAETIAPVQTEAETEAQTEAETQAPVVTTVYQNQEYSIQESGGVYYMNFAGGNKLPAEDGCWVAFVTFDSVSHMKNAFLKNELNDFQKKILRTALCDSNGNIRICSLDNLFEATLPSQAKPTRVNMLRTYYETLFSMDDTIGGSGYLLVIPEDEYTKHYNYYFAKFDNAQDSEIKEATFDGFPCLVMEYSTSRGFSWRDVVYSYGEGDEKVLVRLQYCLKSPESGITYRESDTLPKDIYILGKQHGTYYFVKFSGIDVPVTHELIASFGITPYVEPDAEITPVPAETQAVS